MAKRLTDRKIEADKKRKLDGLNKVRDWVHKHPHTAKEIISRQFADNEDFKNDILYSFDVWARPEQRLEIPTNKDTTLILCGRGWGKTWYATRKAIALALEKPDQRIALWAPDYGSAKRNNWYGTSGILANIHPAIFDACNFNKTDLTLEFPNKSVILTFSAENYDASRGNTVGHTIMDELCSYSYPQEAYDAARLINRQGQHPTFIITTTPRPIKILRDIAKSEDTHLITATTYDNYFLPKSYVKILKKKLTARMFKQEVLAEILDDNLNALFVYEDINKPRIRDDDFNPANLIRIVVGVDPAVTANENSDLTGIIVAGIDDKGHTYILEDASMIQATPEQWARKAIAMYDKWDANQIVAEKNQGGLMVASVLRAASPYMTPVKLVTATRGKAIRAEPIAAMYERHTVHHVGDKFDDLELEQTQWNPTDKNAKSPDRLDALVWALTDLTRDGRMRTPIDVSYGEGATMSAQVNNGMSKYQSY